MISIPKLKQDFKDFKKKYSREDFIEFVKQNDMKEINALVCFDCGREFLTEKQKERAGVVTAQKGECYICKDKKMVTSSRHFNYLVKT